MITRHIRRKVMTMADAGFTVADIVIAADGAVTEAEVEQIIDDADDRAIPHAEPRAEPAPAPVKSRAPRVSRPVTPAQHRPRKRLELVPCGTWGALFRHRKNGDPQCRVCLDAASARRRAKRAAAGAKPRKSPQRKDTANV